ncbi:MAG TPA: undecaprenyl-diphosphatase UppP [Candidatus Kapabacteria bacterium]|jgi:undecaprenyl-diphosphatase|nr:undecaprenyl-diphosphatase UppP [Candidatus Kapabacteria bacterium]
MNILHAIILGLIQGLTEFIPISSTAHLTLYAHFTGLISPQNPEEWTTFMAVIQMGTLVSVLWYFRQDIYSIVKSFITENLGTSRKSFSQQNHNARLGWYIIMGTVPIVAVGLLAKDIIRGNLTKDPLVIASALIILAIILFFVEKKATFSKSMNTIELKDSLFVGFIQCLALIPGSSRSGTTITAGLLRGFTRESAARFSFLLSIPAIAGSGIFELKDVIGNFTSENAVLLLVATIVSGLSGYWAIAFLLKFLKTHSMIVFIVYRILLGLMIFAITF